MVNVSITSTCNRKCTYCFAKDTMDQAGGAAMSLEQFEDTLDFIQKNDIDEARILGGEPTIHPRFVEFLDQTIDRGLRVLLFSGGLIPKSALDRMRSLSVDQLTVLLNVAIPGESPQHEFDRQRHVMSQLGARVTLGINIHAPNVNLDFLLELIDEFGLARLVRLGLTHPMLDGDNAHLHPRYFDEVGRRVADFVRRAREVDVDVEFDCGWVPCMFPEGSLEELEIGPEEVGLRCNPILDVLSDGQVISCYPMTDYHKEHLADWSDVNQLAERFSDRLSPLRPIGIFKRCADCSFRERGECLGGCLSLSMKRLRGHDFAGTMEAVAPTSDPQANSRFRLPVIGSTPTGACERPPEKANSGHSPCGSCGCGEAPIPSAEMANEAKRTNWQSPTERAPALRAQAGPRNAPGKRNGPTWSIPYIDQPMSFWGSIEDEFSQHVENVYLPLPESPIGSGRPPRPCDHTETFLRMSSLHKSVLLNVATLSEPVPAVAPRVVEALKKVNGEYGVTRAVVANFALARQIREALPEFSLTASVLMEITHPYQARLLNDVCSTLVPGSGIARDLPALQAVKEAFQGRIRLLVNEACLPLCPYRAQHFGEMANGIEEPKSLCLDLLSEQPWLRLTGSWVLPQHLHLLETIFDELKLAGRVTLRDPEKYRRVLGAYVRRHSLLPSEIGGGPSSVLEPIDMPEELYRYTLECGRQCHQCTRCPDYYADAVQAVRSTLQSQLT